MFNFIAVIFMRIFEGVFFVGIVGALITVLASWYSIFRDELASKG